MFQESVLQKLPSSPSSVLEGLSLSEAEMDDYSHPSMPCLAVSLLLGLERLVAINSRRAILMQLSLSGAEFWRNLSPAVFLNNVYNVGC